MGKRKVPGKGPFINEIKLDRARIGEKTEYPFSLPVVKLLDRMPLHPRITYLVGENGTGKSTLLEAIAVGAGFNAEGGSKNMRFSTRDTHSVLSDYLLIGRGAARESNGFFLRAESFYNVATYVDKASERPLPTLRERQLTGALGRAIAELERLKGEYAPVDEDAVAALKSELNRPDPWFPGSLAEFYGGSLHERSHGEAFLNLVKYRFVSDSLYILDEPETALSPARQLSLLLRIHELASEENCQFIIATHSPMIMALSDSWMYHLTGEAISRVDWRQTEHYNLTKSFLDKPDAFLHHLLASGSERREEGASDDYLPGYKLPR